MSLPTSWQASLSTVVTNTPPGRSTLAASVTTARTAPSSRSRCSSHTAVTASTDASGRGSRMGVGEHDGADALPGDAGHAVRGVGTGHPQTRAAERRHAP